MKCGEYRRVYNSWLDGRKASPLDAGAELHARECAACRAYARAILRVDACLENLPEVQVPLNLLESALERGGGNLARGRVSLFALGKNVAPVLPPALAWTLSGLLPSPADTASRFLLVSAAIALFALSVIRPRLPA